MPRRDIYIVNVHGTGLTNLTSPAQPPGQLGQAGDNIRCDWSQKSNAIAFTSNRHDPAGTSAANRNDEIYVMNADGSRRRPAKDDGHAGSRREPRVVTEG